MKTLINIKLIFSYQRDKKELPFFILKNGKEHMKNDNTKNEFMSNFQFKKNARVEDK